MLYSGSFENMYLVGPIRKAFKDPIQVPILVIGHFDQCFNLQLNQASLTIWQAFRVSIEILKHTDIPASTSSASSAPAASAPTAEEFANFFPFLHS